MNTHDLWQAALGELELTLSKANFTTWFKNTSIASIEEGKVTISVPNAFTKTWLEKKHNQTILRLLQNASTLPLREVHYRVDMRPMQRPPIQEAFIAAQHGSEPQIGYGSSTVGVALAEPPAQQVTQHQGYAPQNFAPQQAQVAPAPQPQQQQATQDTILNPKYLFETYVVGKGNELAHAASLAVAECPGVKYNPLFIYGGVGLGKTHLIHAIGNEMLRKNPQAKIKYATCEQFINEFIHSVKTGNAKSFKDAYRSVDLLIVDDIQFLSGKDSTQEEFFHTFNALHQANKQVVLTSDRAPKQIPALESRLTSRLEWGMNADISSPDFETRIAILETKCKERGFDFDQETVRYIASIVQSNVRELEGALNKIVAFSQFKNIRPSLEIARSLLMSFGQVQSKKSITAKHLLQVVSQYYDVNPADMLGKCREKRLAFPRQIIMYLMREEMGASYPTIGQELGGRDHTTAMHAYNKIKDEIEANNTVRQDMDLIKQRLYNT